MTCCRSGGWPCSGWCCWSRWPPPVAGPAGRSGWSCWPSAPTSPSRPWSARPGSPPRPPSGPGSGSWRVSPAAPPSASRPHGPARPWWWPVGCCWPPPASRRCGGGGTGRPLARPSAPRPTAPNPPPRPPSRHGKATDQDLYRSRTWTRSPSEPAPAMLASAHAAKGERLTAEHPSKGTVLLVEDEASIADLVRLYLERDGFRVVWRTDGPSGLAAVDAERPRLVLLDLMLPGMDGFEVARAKAVLRRTEPEPESGPEPPLHLGDLTVDPARHEVVFEGRPVRLTAREFELLSYLVRNRGLVLTRDQILERVWGYSFPADTRTVDVHIRQLRAKLGDHAPILTVRGVGYKADDRGSGSGAPGVGGGG